MIDGTKPDDGGPEEPPEPRLPRNGEEVLHEVERLKGEPIQIRCLGVSLATFALVALLVWLLWRFLR